MFDIGLFAKHFGLLNDDFSAMEIGVGPADKCRLISLIDEGYRAYLVEALPKYQQQLQEKYGNCKNVTVVPKGVSNINGDVELYDRGEGSWLTMLPSSPDTQNNNITIDSNFCGVIPSVTMDMIDPGDLDIVLIDTEGAEWLALERMISRPSLLVIETHLVFHEYRNPFLDQIMAWTSDNGYRIIAKEEADTMWVKQTVERSHSKNKQSKAGGTSSETSRIRDRVERYIQGVGIDIGYGGDSISKTSINIDLPHPYTSVGSDPQHLSGDARSLHWFADNVMDYVYSSHLLEDFENMGPVLDEWLRVLRQGGNLILNLPDEEKYRAHCRAIGEPPNEHHSHEDLTPDIMMNLLEGKTETVYVERFDPYSFVMVARKL